MFSAAYSYHCLYEIEVSFIGRGRCDGGEGQPCFTRKRVFLASANASRKRARLILREEASFDLAVRLREGPVPIGDIFSFISGLAPRPAALKTAQAREFCPARGPVIIYAGKISAESNADAW